MAKKKAATATKSLWETLGVQDDKKPAEKGAADVAALQARIEAQDRLLAELQAKGNREYPMVAPATSPEQTVTVDPGTLKVSMEGLPNRDEDPDGFYREYNIRVNAAMEARDRATASQLMAKFDQTRAAERLWNGFKSAYPDWSKYESLVETVTNRVANDLQAKGVDLHRFMMGSPDRFYEEIDKALKQQYGKLLEEPGKRGASEEEEEEDDTTDPADEAVVAGVGSAGAGQAGKGAKSASSQKEPDMFDDLRAIQARLGII